MIRSLQLLQSLHRKTKEIPVHDDHLFRLWVLKQEATFLESILCVYRLWLRIISASWQLPVAASEPRFGKKGEMSERRRPMAQTDHVAASESVRGRVQSSRSAVDVGWSFTLLTISLLLLQTEDS